MWRNIMWTLQLPLLKEFLLGSFQVTRMGLCGFCPFPRTSESPSASHSWGGGDILVATQVGEASLPGRL